MNPLLLSVIVFLTMLNSATAQINNNKSYLTDTVEAQEAPEKEPLPSFESYMDEQQHFVYIKLEDADPYSSYKFVISSVDDQTRQTGMLQPGFTGKVSLKHLERGAYRLKVYDQEGNQLGAQKEISKQ